MNNFTDSDGLAAIEVAKSISARAKETAIIRLFGIAQIFYRQPVGERAADELAALIGPDATCAMFYIYGLSGGLFPIESWAKIVCIESHGAPLQ